MSVRMWYTEGRWTLAVRVSLAGVAAGVVSWLVALTLYPFFGGARPGGDRLLLAVVLGAVIGGAVGYTLGALRDRIRGQRGRRRGPGS